MGKPRGRNERERMSQSFRSLDTTPFLYPIDPAEDPFCASHCSSAIACGYASLLGRFLRSCNMPLQSCPTCGYALSILDHHCRHCPLPLSALPFFRPFDATRLPATITD